MLRCSDQGLKLTSYFLFYFDIQVYFAICSAALSNAAPAIYFSGALRKHIIWADY
jgi:hypothetical protein